MAKLSPVFIEAQFINGIPAVGAQLFTYAAGSTSKQTTYADSAGTTPNPNPIILDARGEPPNAIWLSDSLAYKFVFTSPTDTDPPTSPIRTIDNVIGVGNTDVSISEWKVIATTPTYVSANSFTVLGDQTSEFQVNRRIKIDGSGGTIYGYITDSVFTTLTTVTVQTDSGVLDAGINQVSLSILSASNPSVPSLIDTIFRIAKSTALSIYAKFDLSGLTATRTLSVPDQSGTIALTSQLGPARGITSYNTSQSISATLTGNMILFTGSTVSQTLTLPAANTLAAGAGFWFINQATVNVTVSRSSTDTINKNTLAGVSSATTLTVQPGDCIFLASDGSSVWDMAGQLFGDAFSNSLASSGWQKLPNGLIEQWGSGTTSAGSLAITFPIPFTTACYAFTPAPAQNGNYTASYASLNATSVTVFTYVGNTGVGTNIAISWRATGK